VKTSSSVTTQDAVSQHHGSVTVIMTVETGLMKTAVSGISIIYLLFKCSNIITTMWADAQRDGRPAEYK